MLSTPQRREAFCWLCTRDRTCLRPGDLRVVRGAAYLRHKVGSLRARERRVADQVGELSAQVAAVVHHTRLELRRVRCERPRRRRERRVHTCASVGARRACLRVASDEWTRAICARCPEGRCVHCRGFVVFPPPFSLGVAQCHASGLVGGQSVACTHVLLLLHPPNPVRRVVHEELVFELPQMSGLKRLLLVVQKGGACTAEVLLYFPSL